MLFRLLVIFFQSQFFRMSSRIFFSKIKCTCTSGAFQFNFNFYCFSHFSTFSKGYRLCRLAAPTFLIFERTNRPLLMKEPPAPFSKRTNRPLLMKEPPVPFSKRANRSPTLELSTAPLSQTMPFAPFYKVTKLTFRRNIHISAQLSRTFFGSD